MALTGDFSRFRQLRDRLAKASQKFVLQTKTNMATEIHREIISEFTSSTNPYGRAWAPRKDKRGTWPLLMKSKRLVESVRAIPVARGIKITMKPYGKFLNDGTRYMVARRIVPMNGELPTRWANACDRACNEAAKAVAQ